MDWIGIPKPTAASTNGKTVTFMIELNAKKRMSVGSMWSSLQETYWEMMDVELKEETSVCFSFDAALRSQGIGKPGAVSLIVNHP